MISVNRLRTRKSDFTVNQWMLDSGAFTELRRFGHYRDTVQVYAKQIIRWKSCGYLLCATSQDYMTESFILEKTGLTIPEHQRLTIERYDELLSCKTGVYILPVLQGYQPAEYVDHLRQYRRRLLAGAWVGVGSVCKRNSKPEQIEAVLRAIKRELPDLRIHTFTRHYDLADLGTTLPTCVAQVGDDVAAQVAGRFASTFVRATKPAV